ncbi:MAG: HlyD family secretion protein [Clostridiales Family XIII bacterium]|jgi:multidrug efflux pump subunit AcrA (membrane-fusion protein)|nr:HlyD family secretion protein [Clostridiales Family XIII bacterium]
MKRIKTLDNLKDSVLLYEKTLPVFGYIILLVILVLIAGVIVWSIHIPKMYIIKSSGNVQSVNKNYVMSPYTGELVSVDISEGDIVEKGEVLFTVKSSELDLQDKQLSEQRHIYEQQVEQYNKLVQSVQEDRNLFSPSDADDNLYYSQFELYKSQTAQQKPDIASMKSYGYTDEQIDVEIAKNQGKISELYYSTIRTAEEQILQAQSQIGAIDAQLSAVESGQADYAILANESGVVHMLSDYKVGMVVQTASPIASIGSENDKYKVEAYVLAADASRIEKGDTVDIAVAGLAQNIYGTIGGKVVKIDSDITMPQGGETADNAQPYFKAIIEPDSDYLVSKDGHKVNISNGMAVETRIQYDKVTYFNYVLESLGLLVRG